MSQWLMLVYKIPREPTASRVYVWRKVKQLGAIALQDAVWVLPATPRTREQLQWLAAEIAELGGATTLWTSDLAYESQSATLIEQFIAQADAEYQAILVGLKRKGADLKTISQQYQQAQSRDFFQSPLGQRVRDKLLATRGGKKS